MCDVARKRGRQRMARVTLDGQPLGIADVLAVARAGAAVELGAEAHRRLLLARGEVEAVLASGRAVYGINTGFGSLSRVRIPSEDLAALQRNLILSTAAGVGDPLPDRRGARHAAAARRLAGPRPLRRPPRSGGAARRPAEPRCHPAGPGQGSVGASGDLAPLAHLALVLIGEGEATSAGERLPGASALRRAGLTPVVARREGGAGADQRHPPDGRARRARRPRRGDAARERRGRQPRMSLEALAGQPRARSTLASTRCARNPARQRQRRAPAGAAGGERDRREPPHRRPARAGPLLAALHPAGARRHARHARPLHRA